jgi:hypothetical protein
MDVCLHLHPTLLLPHSLPLLSASRAANRTLCLIELHLIMRIRNNRHLLLSTRYRTELADLILANGLKSEDRRSDAGLSSQQGVVDSSGEGSQQGSPHILNKDSIENKDGQPTRNVHLALSLNPRPSSVSIALTKGLYHIDLSSDSVHWISPVHMSIVTKTNVRARNGEPHFGWRRPGRHKIRK